jgi:hypothetical protein
MKKIFFTLIILLVIISKNSFCQIIYKEPYLYDANLKVYITENRFEADLIVFVVENEWEAQKDGLWYFSEYRTAAKKTVFFVASRIESDLIVYFTRFKVEVGWQREEKNYLLK